MKIKKPMFSKPRPTLRSTSAELPSSRRQFLGRLGAGTLAGAVLRAPLLGSSVPVSFGISAQRGQGGPIRLNHNENPYAPSKRVAEAIASGLKGVNRYPDAEAEELVQKIARSHRVDSDQVILGCGSTEILRAAACAFLGQGKQLVQASPTFHAIEDYARFVGGEVISVPLTNRYAHDLDTMLARIKRTSLLYICNPNNPTASITPRDDLETFISRLPATCYVLIDEAYHHYVSTSAMYASFLDRPLNDERLIVSRSFSMAYGLAGMRLGYGIASPATVKRMRASITEMNANVVAVSAALAALEDTPSLTSFCKRNADDRQEFFNQAMARVLKPIDSHTNFVMMNTFNPASLIVEQFRRNNVLIGPVFPGMETFIRVSLGAPDDMRAFWRVWDSLPIKLPKRHH
jgi:histidinol-phosphate aminotransferase